MTVQQEKVKLFVVIDPIQDRHLALERALVTSKLRQPAAQIHLYVAVDMDLYDTSADNKAIYKNLDWFRSLVQPIEEAEIDYTAEMSWSSDWYSSIKLAAERSNADLIMLPLYQPPTVNLRLFNDSVWRLLRTVHCPVLLVQRELAKDRKVILAAVNFQSHKPEAETLNTTIIERAKWYAEVYQCELHIINAYEDSLNFPDRSQIIKQSGIPNSNIHIVNGKPEEVILSKASELNADVTLLGVRKRSNRWRGQTADRVVNRISGDLLILN